MRTRIALSEAAQFRERRQQRKLLGYQRRHLPCSNAPASAVFSCRPQRRNLPAISRYSGQQHPGSWHTCSPWCGSPDVEVPARAREWRVEAHLPGLLVAPSVLQIHRPRCLRPARRRTPRCASVGSCVVLHSRQVGCSVEPYVGGGPALGEEERVGVDAGVGLNRRHWAGAPRCAGCLGEQLFAMCDSPDALPNKSHQAELMAASAVARQMHRSAREEVRPSRGCGGGGRLVSMPSSSYRRRAAVSDDTESTRSLGPQLIGDIHVVVAIWLRHLPMRLRDHVGGGQQVGQVSFPRRGCWPAAPTVLTST